MGYLPFLFENTKVTHKHAQIHDIDQTFIWKNPNASFCISVPVDWFKCTKH